MIINTRGRGINIVTMGTNKYSKYLQSILIYNL